MRQLVGVLLLTAAWSQASAASPADREPLAGWTDPSPHVSGHVTVDGVRLHYLDWGGAGEPVVLLAGLGNSAHVFDDFAPRLTDAFRVLALTRRGHGESDPGESGYDTARLVADLRGALDCFGLERVHLVGHSLAGSELSGFAARHPERVLSLVYLDAAYDRSRLFARFLIQAAVGNGPPAVPQPSRGERSSPTAYLRYVEKVYGVRWPEAEVRATRIFGADGRFRGERTSKKLTGRIMVSEERPPYARIGAPALALYADAGSWRDAFPWVPAWHPDRLKAERFRARTWEPFALEQQRKFQAELSSSRAVVVPGGRHFLFLSHPDRVAAEVRAFLAAGDASRHVVPRQTIRARAPATIVDLAIPLTRGRPAD